MFAALPGALLQALLWALAQVAALRIWGRWAVWATLAVQAAASLAFMLWLRGQAGAEGAETLPLANLWTASASLALLMNLASAWVLTRNR